MFDILPSSNSPRPRKKRGVLQPTLPPTVPRATAPHTVKLNWQLPARLRRPVGQEIARQRRVQKKQQIRKVEQVQFTRRPLQTPKPLLPATVPPYAGRYIQKPTPPVAPPVVKKVHKPVAWSLETAERDVPYSWATIVPGKNVPSKKKLQRASNLIFFLVGCSLVLGGASQLHRISRGVAVLGSVESRAQQAYEKINHAQTALAASNFTESEQDFAQAHTELSQAHMELDQALAASKLVLQTIDVTGTVRSGTELLNAGEKLTEAGEHLSRGVGPLLDAQVLSDKNAAVKNITIVDALSKSQPEFAQAVEALHSAETSLTKVNPDRLPDSIKSPVLQMKVLVPTVTKALDTFLDQSSVLMSVLGADRDRQYLLVFQNNNEIRPTGGFIGSIALINVSRGAVEDIDVKSVYDPDGQLTERIAPPEELRPITDRWYLRDANWFVDFSASARKVADFLEKEKGPTVDGVIAMTPEVIRQLLSVTGPIEMPAYKQTVTADNFVSLTQDEVTYSYDRAANRPKQFLADLTPILLNKLFASKEGSMKNLGVLSKMIAEKQLLLYFRDEAIQERVEEAGWSGDLPKNMPGLLSINNANVGGHKSDQFMEQEVDYRVAVQNDGSAEAVVTIRRTHHGPEEKLDVPYPEGEDPAFKDNVIWQRVLVPEGSKLLEATGFTPVADVPHPFKDENTEGLTADPQLSEWQSQQHTDTTGTRIGSEAGYTFFGNWVVTKPGQTTISLYRYRLPNQLKMPTAFNLFGQYNLYVAKQAGDTRTTIRTELTLPSSLEIIKVVPTDGITQPEPFHVVYRGKLSRDILLGTLYEKK